jgi:transposase
MPLSLVQLSKKERATLISASDKLSYEQVFRGEGDAQLLIAEGFETSQVIKYELEGEPLSWMERRLFVHGTAYAKSQQAAFDSRIKKMILQLEELPMRKQRKKAFNSKEEYEICVDKLLKEHGLEDFLTVNVLSNETTKSLRAYGNKAARSVTITTFSIEVSKNEAAIEAHQSLLGWQVYATNAPKVLLSFEKCVFKYRHQSNIESSFDHLRNKVAHLVPIFLQKDERIVGLVNLLLLALKVCAILEYKSAEALHKKDEQLCQIYEGNPKRGSKKPSAKRICKAFDGISIALVFVNYKLQHALMTDLEPVQTKILNILNIHSDVYTKLVDKIQIFFLEKIISET